MSIYSLKPRFQALLRPSVVRLHAAGVTANQQYVWGKLFGRHKSAPQLSPSKTVEGFAGGVLSATLLGVALYCITPFQVWEAAAMALLIAVLGFFGGLVLSAIKRDRGIKDWGAMIEGHGGMLDRMDSVAFAAPIFFHVTRFFYQP